MKKALYILFAVFILISSFSLTSCDSTTSKSTLRVFNWGEYISDGEDGTPDVIAMFEEETGIDVEYITYANNEELYAMLSNGGITYDIVFPSDYMFERLYKEGYLQKINKDNIPNYKNILDTYKGIFPFDENDDYSIPYTVGMVGVIYNSDVVSDPKENWDLLWDEAYAGEILLFDNPRDAFAVSQFKLGIDVNSTNTDDWKAAATALKTQKKVLKRYVNDEIFDIMIDGNAAIATYYAGDFLTMKAENDSLEFYYPRDDSGELITNQFIDVMCITKDCTMVKEAEMFIDFMLREDIATANAEYVSYATPNKAVLDNPDYCYSKEKDPDSYNILYPPELDGTMPFNEKLMFRHQDNDIINTMNFEWSSLKADGGDTTALYIVCCAIIAVLIAMMIIKVYIKKKRRIDEEYYSYGN